MADELTTALEALKRRLPGVEISEPKRTPSGENLTVAVAGVIRVTVIRGARYAYYDIEKGAEWLYGGLDPGAAAEAIKQRIKNRS